MTKCSVLQLADFKKVDNHVSKMYALITIRFDTFIRMCVTSFRRTFVKVGLLFHLQSGIFGSMSLLMDLRAER